MKKFGFGKNNLDILKELANIGTGNAVTSLSRLLNEERIAMQVPVARLAPLQELPELLGGAELPVAGVYIEAHGDAIFKVLFLLPLESATKLISILVPGSGGELDEMGVSALLEVGNILTSSYLNALSFMTDLRFLPSPPQIAVDMSGAIIASLLAEAHIADDEVVLLKTALYSSESRITGHILILPDCGTLNKVFFHLGVRCTHGHF